MTNPIARTQSAQKQLLELTSVRAFAALTVVFFHMYQPNPGEAPSLWRRLIRDGHLGVDFFFILSGFILTHVYISRWRAGDFKYRPFLWARFARIYPLHLTMIILFLAAYGLAEFMGFDDLGGMRWDHLHWHVLLLHSWGFTETHSWNFPSWSVSAEAFAYLAFPAFLFLLPLRRPWLTAAIATTMLLTAWFTLSDRGITLTKLMYDFGIVRILFEFCLGIAVYLVYEQMHIGPVLASSISGISFLIVLAVAAIQGPEIISVLMFATIILGLGFRSQSPKPSLLRSPALVYLGEISYSTYMVHLLILMAARKIFEKVTPGLEWGGLPGVLMTLTVIYIGSIVFHHGVEVPARWFLRHRPSQSRSQPPQIPAPNIEASDTQ